MNFHSFGDHIAEGRRRKYPAVSMSKEYEDKKLWNKYFGEAWDAVCAMWKNIGGFVMDENAGIACADENAITLFGLKERPDCKKLREVLDLLARSQKGFVMPLETKLLDTPEGITAGFVYIPKGHIHIQHDCGRPVVAQAELMSRLAMADEKTLLALVRLEGDEKLIEADICLDSILSAVCNVLPENAVLSQHSAAQFWITSADFEGDPKQLAKSIKHSVENSCLADEFGIHDLAEHSMTVTAGISVGFAAPSDLIHAAGYALYEAKAKGAGASCVFTPEQYASQKNEIQDIRAFSELLDKNLFTYHFQPIVSASTGDIVAYEALMRTKGDISLNPLQILESASRFGRLYDIEKATIGNTLKYLSKHQSDFENKRLFINSISSHMLTEEDFCEYENDFGELLEKVVIEMTEQTEISDRDLERIRSRLDKNNMNLAIDDYGTGYSNTSNLMRYEPEIVKIDRSLITGIDKNHKMQRVVSKIIEFLHASGCTALAEGVETKEELQTMIGFGVDLIQGYYVSKPKPVLLHGISDNIKDEIIQFSMEASEDQKIYHAVDGDRIDLEKLRHEKYSSIFIGSGSVVIFGGKEKRVPMTIAVKDRSDCTITLKDAYFESPDDQPDIRLGNGSKVKLICVGKNKLSKRGILVPESAELEISGSGDLEVFSEVLDCYGIGASHRQSCGRIVIAMAGDLYVKTNGENCIGIGGGNCEKGVVIRSGAIDINASGNRCVGIGSFHGKAELLLENFYCHIKMSSDVAVGIGSVDGESSIKIRNYKLDSTLSGRNLTTIGAVQNGTGSLEMRDGRADIVVKGQNINCIGTRNGAVGCSLYRSIIKIYCEGGTVSGVGDMTGSGNITADSCLFDIALQTGDGWGIGSKNGACDLADCVKDIKINR